MDKGKSSAHDCKSVWVVRYALVYIGTNFSANVSLFALASSDKGLAENSPGSNRKGAHYILEKLQRDLCGCRLISRTTPIDKGAREDRLSRHNDIPRGLNSGGAARYPRCNLYR
jgi:hypothetical protein